jgi:hypothetical protein
MEMDFCIVFCCRNISGILNYRTLVQTPVFQLWHPMLYNSNLRHLSFRLYALSENSMFHYLKTTLILQNCHISCHSDFRSWKKASQLHLRLTDSHWSSGRTSASDTLYNANSGDEAGNFRA